MVCRSRSMSLSSCQNHKKLVYLGCMSLGSCQNYKKLVYLACRLLDVLLVLQWGFCQNHKKLDVLLVLQWRIDPICWMYSWCYTGALAKIIRSWMYSWCYNGKLIQVFLRLSIAHKKLVYLACRLLDVLLVLQWQR